MVLESMREKYLVFQITHIEGTIIKCCSGEGLKVRIVVLGKVECALGQ